MVEPTANAATLLAAPPSRRSGRSQSQIIVRRFLHHRVAMVSLCVLVLMGVFSVSATGIGPLPGWWHYDYQQLNSLVNGGRPTMTIGAGGFSFGEHPFGQDRIGRDYFAMTMRGIQNSFVVMIAVAGVATVVGAAVGGIAGYYGGRFDNLLMRLTDLVMIVPLLVIAAVVGQIAGNIGGPLVLGLLLGTLSWPSAARLVRAEFLSYREREFVDAARVSAVPDARIIVKHIMPNAIGVIIVSGTLVMAGAVILEASLSYLGLGVRAPDVSLGAMISQNQTSAIARPWLFWWPGGAIILLALAVNFVGDGLRDAFDPRQKLRKRVRRMPMTRKETAR